MLPRLKAGLICICVCVFSCVQLLVTPWSEATSLLCLWNFLGEHTGVVGIPFSRESFPPQTEPASPALAGGFFTTCPTMASVQFSFSVVSDSLRPHGLPCPSPTPGAFSDSYESIKLMMPANHLILCCPLLILPSILSGIKVF